mgnify:CR=1 FL=1
MSLSNFIASNFQQERGLLNSGMSGIEVAAHWQTMPENIEAAEAHIAAEMAVCLGEITKGTAIQPQIHTDPNACKGFAKSTFDTERNGRWS